MYRTQAGKPDTLKEIHERVIGEQHEDGAGAVSVTSTLDATARTGWLLRVSLGVVYVWFGGLKLVGMSPVTTLVRNAYPMFEALPIYVGLALFEVVLGIALLVGAWTRHAAAAAVLHLIATFGLLIASPRMVFQPWFPFLTMEGEFVMKNLVLLATAAALWSIAAARSAQPAFRPRLRVWALLAFVVGTGGITVAGMHLHDALKIAVARAAAPVGETRMTAADIGALTDASAPTLVVEGHMVDRCPLLGCWLTLRDDTGTVFVDLAPSGLSAARIQVGAAVRVWGRLGRTREGVIGFIASHLEKAPEGNTL
ncbi:MAG: DUF417 family protein [Vicinamibacteraceae bacterium]